MCLNIGHCVIIIVIVSYLWKGRLGFLRWSFFKKSDNYSFYSILSIILFNCIQISSILLFCILLSGIILSSILRAVFYGQYSMDSILLSGIIRAVF